MPGAERAVFFDAGNTLVHAWPSVGEVYAEVALRHGVSASPLALEAAFRRIWNEKDLENERLGQNDRRTLNPTPGARGADKGVGQDDRRTLNPTPGADKGVGQGVQRDERAWWKRIVTRVFDGLPPFADFDAFFEELYVSFGKETRWRLYDDAREVLETLSARGVPMAVVSNWDSRLMSLLEQLDIARYFKTVVISAVVGSSKPEKRIFEIACERMAVEPASVLHIGDNLEDDIAGAKAIGISPVWIDRLGSTAPAPAGAHKITDLREILAFL